LPELEQELLQLEQIHTSPIPKMRFYQGISWIENLFDTMTAHILQSGLLQIKCFATNTISSQGYNSSFIHIQDTFTNTLNKHRIWVDITLANGISLLEDLVKSHDTSIMKKLPTGNNALHLYIIQHTLYICIYKSIPVGLHIESQELAEVMYFMIKHCV
jgi:sRNA-binding regulator protein Hfq